MTGARRVLGFAALSALLCSACQSQPPVIERWLLCDHCPPELQDSVAALGDAAIAPLARGLGLGPRQLRIQNVRWQAADNHAYAESYLTRHPGSGSVADSATFVRLYAGNYVASYQKRAALALRAIGSTTARAALHDTRLAHAANPFPWWRADVDTLASRIDSDPPVIAVSVAAGQPAVASGGTTTVTATVVGVGQLPQGVAWTSSDPTRATVSAVGVVVVTPVATPGPVVIRACSVVAPVCGAVTITVTP